MVAVGTVADLEVVNIRVAPVLEGVVVEVTSTRVAIITGTHFLEVVDVKVAVFPKVIVVIGRLHWHIRLLGQPVVGL